MQQDGTAIRFTRTIFVLEDDACFCLYAARNADDGLEAARRAGIRCAGVAQPIAVSSKCREAPPSIKGTNRDQES